MGAAPSLLVGVVHVLSVFVPAQPLKDAFAGWNCSVRCVAGDIWIWGGTAGARKAETKAWYGQDLTAPSPSPCFLQIVRLDRSMEQIIFPVPGICEFLTKETKYRLFTTTEQDEQGSKVSDFFDQSSFLHNEMEWQKKLRSKSKPDLPSALAKLGLFE